MNLSEIEKNCLSEYLRLMREAGEEAWVDTENGSVHFEEYDEKHKAYVPVVMTIDQVVNHMMELAGVQ